MPKRGKNYKAAVASYDKAALHEVPEAMKIAVEKFHISSENIFINTLEENENETLFEALIYLLFQHLI